jgi:hypothetical protein
VTSNSYNFCGLHIGSPLDLYGLRRVASDSSRTPDIEISLAVGAMPHRRPVTYAWQGRFQLTIEGGGGAGWTIRHRDDVAIDCDATGARIACTCSDPAQIAVLGEILSRRLLPRLASLHGRLPIHAASLADDDGAVLVFGMSGAGKSTLTAAMAAAGWDIMSDDMSILSGSDDPHVWQTAPGVSLWEPSRRGLDLPDDACRPIGGYDGKYWYVPPHRPRDAPAPVAAANFLSYGAADDAVEWRQVAGATALVMAASQMVRFDPADNDETALRLDGFRRLVERVPCYTLAYPRTIEALPRTIAAITAIRHHARHQAQL